MIHVLWSHALFKKEERRIDYIYDFFYTARLRAVADGTVETLFFPEFRDDSNFRATVEREFGVRSKTFVRLRNIRAVLSVTVLVLRLMIPPPVSGYPVVTRKVRVIPGYPGYSGKTYYRYYPNYPGTRILPVLYILYVLPLLSRQLVSSIHV